jgi:hypothetical protein
MKMNKLMNGFYQDTCEELQVSMDSFGTSCIKVFNALHLTW